MKVIEINENEFEEKVKKSKNKILVDCYAEWCGPCRMLSPIIDEVSEEIDTCEFYKLNVDEAGSIAMEYGIMSIPTILVFDNGELKSQTAGFMSKGEILDLLNV